MGAEATMQAVYLERPGRLTQKEIPVPKPGHREVLVAVRSVGICGSDMHYYERGRLGDFVVRQPLILGHECAGEVVELGPEVTTLHVGDRVALEPGIPCRHCEHCLSGRYNLCRGVAFLGTPPDHHGTFRQYVTSPEDFAYKLPDNVSTEVGATVEPLSVGLHGVNLVRLLPGESVVVLGAGPIGLLAIAAARAAGATDITAVDLVPMRLDFAARMGAARTVNAGEVNVAEALADAADVVMDCVGVEATLSQCFDVARPGGRVAWIGVDSDVAHVPLVKALRKELSIVTVFRYAGVYKRAVNLLGEGTVDTAPIITHRFQFPQVAEALKFASENRQLAVKTMVNFD